MPLTNPNCSRKSSPTVPEKSTWWDKFQFQSKSANVILSPHMWQQTQKHHSPLLGRVPPHPNNQVCASQECHMVALLFVVDQHLPTRTTYLFRDNHQGMRCKIYFIYFQTSWLYPPKTLPFTEPLILETGRTNTEQLIICFMIGGCVPRLCHRCLMRTHASWQIVVWPQKNVQHTKGDRSPKCHIAFITKPHKIMILDSSHIGMLPII